MAVLSFAENSSQNLSLSNTATPCAPGIFHTKYGSKETPSRAKICNKNKKQDMSGNHMSVLTDRSLQKKSNDTFF